MLMLPAVALELPVLDAEMVPPSASRICGALSVMFPPGPLPAGVLKIPLWPVGDDPVIVIDSLAVTPICLADPLARRTPVLAAEMVPPSKSWIWGDPVGMFPPGPVPAVVLKIPLWPVGDDPVMEIASPAVTSICPAGPLPGSTPVLAAEMVPPPKSWIWEDPMVMFPPGPVPAVVLKIPLWPGGEDPVVVDSPAVTS